MEQPKSLLCVDDEQTPLFFRKLVLERSGFKVTTANSAREALEKLAENVSAYDLVLSDQLMPEVTGTQLAKQVKDLYPHMPFVLVSGVNEIPQDASYADLFVSKLEGPAVLCEKIRLVLEHYRTKNETPNTRAMENAS